MSLDATIGGVSANSYVTLGEATDYFSDRAHSSAWEDEDEQESMLITASKTLDWYSTWKGQRATGEQSMDWPRIGVLDKVGLEYPIDAIPQDVKTATYEMALASLEADRLADSDLAGLAEVKAASLMIKTDNGLHSTKVDVVPDHIKNILSDLTKNSGIGVVRLIRA